jgi:hypothetical protein
MFYALLLIPGLAWVATLIMLFNGYIDLGVAVFTCLQVVIVMLFFIAAAVQSIYEKHFGG